MSNVKSATVKKINAEVLSNDERTSVIPEKRYLMVSEAAYFRAEKRGFVGGDVAQDWQEAEAEIDRILQQQLESGNEDMTMKQAHQQKFQIQLKEWETEF